MRPGVAAGSVYEVVVLALAKFRRCGLADATFGPATRLTIRVKQPGTEHTVGKLQSWLDGEGRSPNEHVFKTRLRKLL